MQARSRNGFSLQWGLALLVVTLTAMAFTASAVAQRAHGAASSHWRGDNSRLHGNGWNSWRGGHWTHGRHDGRLGWWWAAGGLWYFHPAPVYPYPNPWEPPLVLANPPVDVVPPVPPTQYWYFCEASRAYYPYAATCPGGWQQVPATPGDSSLIPLK